MEDNSQFVYILSFSEKEHLCKIGKTKNHPEVRADQLSKHTASIGTFKLEWCAEVPDMGLFEKLLHSIFEEFRIDPKKEFFNFSPEMAIKVASNAIKNILPVYNEAKQDVTEINRLGKLAKDLAIELAQLEEELKNME